MCLPVQVLSDKSQRLWGHPGHTSTEGAGAAPNKKGKKFIMLQPTAINSQLSCNILINRITWMALVKPNNHSEQLPNTHWCMPEPLVQVTGVPGGCGRCPGIIITTFEERHVEAPPDEGTTTSSSATAPQPWPCTIITCHAPYLPWHIRALLSLEVFLIRLDLKIS